MSTRTNELIQQLRTEIAHIESSSGRYQEVSVERYSRIDELARQVMELQEKLVGKDRALAGKQERINELELRVTDLLVPDGRGDLRAKLDSTERALKAEIDNRADDIEHKDGIIASLRVQRDRAIESSQRRERTMRAQHEADMELLRARLANIKAAVEG